MGDVTCNGIRLSYEVTGDGEPVVLIAGTGMPPIVWHLGLAPALIGAGYRIVTFANRGIEPSDAPPAPYTVEEMAWDTAALIETLELGPSHIVGFSMGGFVAEELCYRRADLVRDVVLMASAGRPSSFVKVWVQAEVDLATALDPAPTSQSVRDLLVFLLPFGALQEDASVDPMRMMFEASPPWTNPGRLGQWSADLAWINDEQRAKRWSQLTHRCLAIGFEHDIVFPPDRAEEATSAMPNGHTVEIAGAAHGGFLTHCDDVSKAIVEFWSRD
jgi:pimeloyl-ACP methyl ester carboxylesterase